MSDNRRRPPVNSHTYHRGGQGAGYNPQSMAARRAARRRRVRRNRIIGLLVLLAVVILAVVLVVYLVKGGEKPASSTPPASITESLPPQPEEPPAKEEPAVDISAFSYYEEEIPLLVNKENPIPEGLADNVDTVEVGIRPDTLEMHSLAPNAARAFLDMMAAAEADGIELWPVSGYREHTRQVNNYAARVNEYLAQGHSQETAEQLASEIIAVPGTSEHEIGLAIDINSLDTTFENTEAFAWLSAHCTEYGFILRYEKDTYDETGISYEPWHYRYVGDNHAKAIAEQGVTLEAYVAALQAKQAG